MGRTQGFTYIYVVVPKERANLGPKNVDPSYFQTCSKSPQNSVGRVITSPNAFLVRTGLEVSGLVGVDFGLPPRHGVPFEIPQAETVSNEVLVSPGRQKSPDFSRWPDRRFGPFLAPQNRCRHGFCQRPGYEPKKFFRLFSRENAIL